MFLLSLSEPDNFEDYDNNSALFTNWITFASYIINSLPPTSRIGIYTENQGIVQELQSLSQSESNTNVSQSSSLLSSLIMDDVYVGGREHGGEAIINLLPLTFDHQDATQDSASHVNVLILMIFTICVELITNNS